MNLKSFYDLYISHGLKPVICLGYSKGNKDYRKAKIPIHKYAYKDFNTLTLDKCQLAIDNNNWIAWKIPKGLIVLDIEEHDAISRTVDVLEQKHINYALHSSNNGVHIFLKNTANISGSSKEIINTGDTVTFKTTSQLVTLAPINDRSWDIPLTHNIGEIPIELYPKKDNISVLDELEKMVSELESKQQVSLDPYIMPKDLVHIELIEDIADMLSVHSDVVYMYFLSIISGLIGNAGYTHVWGGWNEPLFLWFIHIGDPAYRKTPIMNLLRKAITTWQVKSINESKKHLDNYETDLALYKSKKAKIAKASKWDKKEEMPEEPKKPSTKRYYVTDFTFESLSELYEQNEKGVSILIDELSLLFSSLNAYKEGGKDEKVLLDIYNGGTLTIDRVTKGSKVCEKSGSSIAGGIQPNVFTSLFSGKSDKGDGMLSRFNVLHRKPIQKVMTVELADAMYSKAQESTKKLEEIYNKINTTFSSVSNPTQFKVTGKAKELFVDFYNEIHQDILPSITDVQMRQFVAKITGKCARLAGVLRAMEFCSVIDDTSQPEKLEIDEETMDKAIYLCKFLMYESDRVYKELLT